MLRSAVLSCLVVTLPENVPALEGLACRKHVAPARVRRLRRLPSTLAAAPGLFAHALVKKAVNADHILRRYVVLCALYSFQFNIV